MTTGAFFEAGITVYKSMSKYQMTEAQFKLQTRTKS